MYEAECTEANSRLQAVNFDHTLSNHYAIASVNTLKNMWAHKNGFEYDLVFRVRPDTKFISHFPDNIKSGELYVPAENSYGGVNDLFAVGSSSEMDKYAKCFEFIPEYFKSGGNFHPETMLNHCLIDNDVSVKTFPGNFELIR
jgi:hypothetical protein